jgi:hypothetical protein
VIDRSSSGAHPVSDDEIDAVRTGHDLPAPDDAERATIHVTDELALAARPREATFAKLRRHVDDRVTTELVATIEFHGLACRMREMLRVDPEGTV